MHHELDNTPSSELAYLPDAGRMTPNQLAAATQVEHSMAVSAGAGAGKTLVLVSRFLALLHAGASPSEIVAITFTNKAAQEMQERIYSSLQRLAGSDPRAREWLVELPAAGIATIHSLAATLVRLYPLSSGSDPNFATLEEHQSQALLKSAARDSLIAWLASSQLPAGFVGTMGAEELMQAIIAFITTLRNRGEDITLLLQEAAAPPPPALEPPFKNWYQYLVGGNLKIPKNATRVQRNVDELAALCERAQNDPRSNTLLEEICAILGEIEKANMGNRSNKTAAELQAGLDELVPEVGLSSWHCVSAWQHQLLFPLWSQVVHLLHNTYTLYQQKKAALNALDYADLIVQAMITLQHPEVASSVHQRWRFFLVDEFQDVDYNQYKLVQLLCGSRLRESLFVCGDRQQSIYRFRGAVVALFQQMITSLAGELGADKTSHLSLRDNFRSQEPLLTVVNSIFRQLWKDEYQNMVGHRGVGNPAAQVELILSEGSKSDEMRQNEAHHLAQRLHRMVQEGELIIRQGQGEEERLRPAQWRDIALLFRTRTAMGVYEAALQSLGIPTRQHAGRDFYQRPEILAFRALLRTLLYPEDSLSLWQWLTSTYGGISPESLALGLLQNKMGREVSPSSEASEPLPNRSWGGSHLWANLQLSGVDREMGIIRERQLRRWRRWLTLLPLPELLQRICRELGLAHFHAASEGEQEEANLRKFGAILTELQEDGATLPDILRQLDDLVLNSAEGESPITQLLAGNAVLLMTVHGAKGLEFPIVALPDMIRGKSSFSGNPLFYYGEAGLAFPTQVAKVQEIKEREAQGEDEESLRLLYVAMTRARDYLILSGPLAKLRLAPGSWWSKVADLLPQEVAGGLVKIYQPQPPVEVARLNAPSAESEPQAAAVEFSQEIASRQNLTPELIRELATSPRMGEVPLIPGAHTALAITSLQNYRRCPRLYYLQSRLRLAPPFKHRSGFDLELEPSPALGEKPGEEAVTSSLWAEDPLSFGSLIHQLSQEMVQNFRQSQANLPLEELLRERALAYHYSVKQATPLAEQVLPMLEQFNHSELMQQVRQSKKVFTELPFSYLLPSGVMLRGIIDLVLLNQDETISLFDYKTNLIRPYLRRRLAEQYRLQMHLYALAALEYWQLPLHEASLYLFRAPWGEEREQVLSGANSRLATETLAEADELAVGIAGSWREHHFAKLPPRSAPCRSCGYQALCYPRRSYRVRRKTPS
ncbi:MAG: UvrD-helicase domain-containing protein [Symbiobacteriaceae bacterium]|nr:UvrD-helicase domain-containing protein [Symbiobacteriaceae bacterium]